MFYVFGFLNVTGLLRSYVVSACHAGQIQNEAESSERDWGPASLWGSFRWKGGNNKSQAIHIQ